MYLSERLVNQCFALNTSLNICEVDNKDLSDHTLLDIPGLRIGRLSLGSSPALGIPSKVPTK